MWNGTFDDWDLALEVAKIPDAVWNEGPEAVAAEIETIRSRRATSERAITAGAVAEVRQRVAINRDAIALSVASLLEQLTKFWEHVRGINHLDVELRREILDFIDLLSGRLEVLLHQLPEGNELISDAKAKALIHWYREFQPLVRTKMAAYIAPANIAEASVPAAVILGCTAIGTLVGGPVGGAAGAVVGNLITNQIKPGKAAEELMNRAQPGEDAAG